MNPSSLILSGVMLLEHISWTEAADLIVKALQKTIRSKIVTYGLPPELQLCAIPPVHDVPVHSLNNLK